MKPLRLVMPLVLTGNLFATGGARVVKYHANDIVPIHARVHYTTLVELPPSEKILEIATGDRDFWIIDSTANYCFLHPAKESIHSNLNLITDKGNVYSFTLDEMEDGDPDLKVVIEPSDEAVVAATNGAPRWVPVTDLDAIRAELKRNQNQTAKAIEQFRSEYPVKDLHFDYSFRNEKPFAIEAIYHDSQFTYIKSGAQEKYAVYEWKDGKPDLVNFQLTDGTYVLPKVIDSGYLEIGKHRLTFTRVAQ